jgi:hypothetical protein
MSVPWPPGIAADEETCAVALEVIVAKVTGDGGLKPDQQIPWVAWGSGQATLHSLFGQAFHPPASEILRYELAEIGEIDPTCPVRLERRTAFPASRVFLDAVILPVGARQAAELSAILRDSGGARARHAAALTYVRELEQRWAAECPARILPRVDLRQDFVVTRAADAPLAEPDAQPAPALA